MEQIKSGRKERIKSSQLGTLSGRGMALSINREGVDFTSLPMYILGIKCVLLVRVSMRRRQAVMGGWMTESNTWFSQEPWSSGRKNDKSMHKAQVQVGFSHFF